MINEKTNSQRARETFKLSKENLEKTIDDMGFLILDSGVILPFPNDSFKNGFNGKEETILSLESIIQQTKDKAVKEYKDFILNILDGVDEADKQMGVKNGGTKSIRLAIDSRV